MKCRSFHLHEVQVEIKIPDKNYDKITHLFLLGISMVWLFFNFLIGTSDLCFLVLCCIYYFHIFLTPRKIQCILYLVTAKFCFASHICQEIHIYILYIYIYIYITYIYIVYIYIYIYYIYIYYIYCIYCIYCIYVYIYYIYAYIYKFGQ